MSSARDEMYQFEILDNDKKRSLTKLTGSLVRLELGTSSVAVHITGAVVSSDLDLLRSFRNGQQSGRLVDSVEVHICRRRCGVESS